MSLSSLLVQRGVASIRDVEEALARQVLYGGDLATNLLEVATLKESVLAALVAESMGRDAGPVGDLAVPRDEVLRLVSPALAVKEGLMPYEVIGASLIILVSEPLDAETEWRLSAELAMPIVQRVVLHFRLRQLLSKAYRFPLERRCERLLARLGESVPVTESALRASIAPRAPSIKPPAAPSVPAPAPAPASSEAPPTASRPSPSLGSRPRKRRKGPLTLQIVKTELDVAADRDAILDLFFEFARQYFEYTGLFIVHGEIAEGREAYGEGARNIEHVGIPLDLPGTFATARAKKMASLYTLQDSGVDAELQNDLGRTPGGAIGVVPVVVSSRVVALLYGDDAENAVEMSSVDAVQTCSELVSLAFERIIRMRKGGPSSKPQAISKPPEDPADSIPTDRHVVLPELDVPVVTQRKPLARPIIPREDEDAPRVSTEKPFQSVSQSTSQRTSQSSPPPRQSSPPKVERTEPEVWRPEPEAAAPAPSAPDLDVWKPGDPIPAEPSAPNLDQLEDPSARAFIDEINRRDSTPMPDEPPASLAYSARPPPPRLMQAPEGLPSVIVDVEFEHADLVDRICTSPDLATENELIRLGNDAMPAIMARFPGPIRVAVSETAPLPKVTDCGPLLRVIARQRRIALPSVLPYCDDGDLERRLYATFLLTELHYPETVDVLGRRLVDDDIRVRRVATAAARLVCEQDPRLMIERLIGIAQDPLTAPLRCVIVLGAVAELRQPIAVPMVIPFLSDANSAIVNAARDALCLLARQDFKSDARKWSSWWASNVGRHRIEWLIDALLHDDAGIRRSAAIELADQTGMSIGLVDEGNRRDRERVHLRFREWWLGPGRAKFMQGT